MSAVLEENNLAEVELTPPVVVVGTGPVGIRFVEELLQREPGARVVIYGNEPWEPYNRVRLAGLLTGEFNLGGIQNPIRLDDKNSVVQHHNCEIVRIDRELKQVYDKFGNTQKYSQLILATGSSPHIPDIEGMDKSGIYTFRNLDDTQELIARRVRSRRVIVLGGGLLGLEAARGLQKYNTSVTVIEHAPRLMSRQLDEEAAEMLRENMMLNNLTVILGDGVKEVFGDEKVKALRLHSGRIVECDTLVLATGIKPNINLALESGLAVGRGIRVNDQMQTNDAAIYAIGECAEHRGKIYGLVAPGLEQAGVAAHSILEGKSDYVGSQSATRLKVIGVNLLSAGRTGEEQGFSQLKEVVWRSSGGDRYRKLFLKRNRIVGVIGYGDWEESSRVQEAVMQGRMLWPWHLRRFIHEGNLWPEEEASEISEWPASSIVCKCTNVTRGTLSKSIQEGCATVDDLCARTGASSVCGSCKPLLSDLLGSKTIEPEPGNRVLTWTAAITLLLTFIIMLAPPIPFVDSVQVPVQWDVLWRDGLIKQISGFSLLGLAVLVSLISLRKRINRFTLGKFSSWRVIHVVLGVLAITTLIAHTGFRLGNHLNLYLMLSFTGLILSGGLASGIIGLQHVLPRRFLRSTREISIWSHILLLWPLPALLGFHVLKTYWF